MKLYRSIGEDELRALLANQTIYGKYNCASENQNNGESKNACCFFVDEAIWRDSAHRFLIVVDIPTEELDFGVGDYFAGKSLQSSKIWSGRNGSLHYKIREAYALHYSIKNVKEIFLFDHFANWYVNGCVKPVCDANGIVLHHMDKIAPFENSSQKFIKVSYKKYGCDYVTNDFEENWLNTLKVDVQKYIEETRELVNKATLTISQAKQIRAILNAT